MVNVTVSYYPKTFASEGSKLLLDICLADSRILYFWYFLKSIQKFIIELHSLQCLFARGSNKKQRRGRIISNSTKEETFSSLMTASTLGSNLIMRSPFLHPSKKTFLSSSVWPRREYTWTLNWKESLLIYFENCQDVLYSLEQEQDDEHFDNS